MITNATRQTGIFARWRSRLFGVPDPVEAQLADVAKEGLGMARLAHLCGSLMLLLFSLGSALGICASLITSLTRTGIRWASAPDTIALTVSVMLVLCMDVASLYASFKIRQLATRREPKRAYLLHLTVIVVASILESGTFAYMSWLYDDPTVAVVAALILVRALAAPFFAIYLNSARAIPVGPRDIFYQAELATGIGVLRDVVRIAADPTAPLARKLELFRASARMSEGDRTQLDSMIAVVDRPNARTQDALTEPAPSLPPESPPDPNGGIAATQPDAPSLDVMRSNLRALPIPTGRVRRPKPPKPVRADTGRPQVHARVLRDRRMAAARRIIAEQPSVGVRDLTRQIAMSTHQACSQSTAQELRCEILAEMRSEMRSTTIPEAEAAAQ